MTHQQAALVGPAHQNPEVGSNVFPRGQLTELRKFQPGRSQGVRGKARIFREDQSKDPQSETVHPSKDDTHRVCRQTTWALILAPLPTAM